MELGAIFSGKCEDLGLLEEIDVRNQVYSKLFAEDYAEYGGIWTSFLHFWLRSFRTAPYLR